MLFAACFVLLLAANICSAQTIRVAPTSWETLADLALHHYEWYDPAKLATLKAWVNREAPYEGANWDAGPPSGLTKLYPVVARDANGVYRPQGPNLFPQEEYTYDVTRRYVASLDTSIKVWTPLAPKAGNLIDDPGYLLDGPVKFEDPQEMGVYLAPVPAWGEQWSFNNAHLVFSTYALGGQTRLPDPVTFLSPRDLATYNAYALKRGRLQRLRAQYFTTMRQAFDLYDWERLRDALRSAPPGSTVELGAGDFYFHRALSNAKAVPGALDYTVEWEFAGNAILGQGKSTTRLRTLPGATFEWGPDELNYMAFFFAYKGSPDSPPVQLTVSGMSFIVDERTKEWIQHGVPANTMAGVLTVEGHGGRQGDIEFNNLEVIGAVSDAFYGLWAGRSIFYGTLTDGINNGSVVYRGVDFKNLNIPIGAAGSHTRFTVGGSPNDRCTLINNVAGVVPLPVLGLIGSTVEISYNMTDNVPMLSLIFGTGEQNSYLVSHNYIYVEQSEYSPFELWRMPGVR